jgi:hypothetical protein
MRSIFFTLAVMLFTSSAAWADCAQPAVSTLKCVAEKGGAKRFEFTDTEYSCDGQTVRFEQNATAWENELTITHQDRQRSPDRIPANVQGENQMGLDSMNLRIESPTSGSLTTFVAIGGKSVVTGPIKVSCSGR